MTKPERFEAILVSREKLANFFWLFRLKVNKKINFLPGQFVSVEVGNGEKRFYSIANSKLSENCLELLIRIYPEGVGGKFWSNVKVGELIKLFGPAGRFLVKNNRSGKMVFMATGCGIAPIRSMIGSLADNNAGEIKLWWGLRGEEDVFWLEEWNRLKQQSNNFDYEIVLSKPTEEWKGKKGHITDYLRDLELNNGLDDVYICGGAEMISEVTKKLAEMGFCEDGIHYEKY